jgi:ABC-type sugar transport system permease subunit
MASTAQAPRSSWWARSQRKIAPYLFISPFYILFAAFLLGPVAFAFILSFNSWNVVEAMRWAGLGNYLELFKDETFWEVAINTVWYSAASLFLVCPLALLLALILNSELVRLKGFFRTVYFMPIITSVVVIAIMFILLYNRDYGLINAALRGIGIEPLNWLGSTDLSKVSVIGLIVWRWTGHHMIYFLAGLQSIPRDLYEAAWVDGANRWQSFVHITLPMLRPVILFVAVITLIGSAQIFEEPYILTGGGPVNSSRSLAMYLYRVGIEYLRLGYAATLGFAAFFVIFFLSRVQMRLLGIFREE